MAEKQTPALAELVPVSELQSKLAAVFPTRGSLEWQLRAHRAAYLEGGALFQIAGRLLAHPPSFERVTLAIASRKIASRAGA